MANTWKFIAFHHDWYRVWSSRSPACGSLVRLRSLSFTFLLVELTSNIALSISLLVMRNHGGLRNSNVLETMWCRASPNECRGPYFSCDTRMCSRRYGAKPIPANAHGIYRERPSIHSVLCTLISHWTTDIYCCSRSLAVTWPCGQSATHEEQSCMKVAGLYT